LCSTPRKGADDEEPTTTSSQASIGHLRKVGPNEPHGRRILFANGVPEISRFVGLALSTAHHQVISVDNADDALALAAQGSFDLVLVDLWLSGSYDLSLVRKLAEIGGPPVVILSDPPNEHELKRALDAGAVDYVSSPVSGRDLLERVQMALSPRSTCRIRRVAMDARRVVEIFLSHETKPEVPGRAAGGGMECQCQLCILLRRHHSAHARLTNSLDATASAEARAEMFTLEVQLVALLGGSESEVLSGGLD
jgi:CheY-like chemotaxis protein